jgi:pilus assembly protein CpaE
MNQMQIQRRPPVPALIVSFDDKLAVRFSSAVESACTLMHVSPAKRSLESAVKSLNPAVAIFDLHSVKTSDTNIFDLMEEMSELAPDVRKIAIGYQSVTAQVIAAMKAGACDFVDRESNAQEIMDAVLPHLRQSRPRNRPADGANLIGVVAARQNEGEAAIVSNLAIAIAAAQPNKRVLLVDLGLEASELEISFDVEITYTVRDAVDDVSQQDEPMLDRVLARHKSGVYLLPLATQQHSEDEISSQDLAVVVGTLRRCFDTIVVNAGCLRQKSCQPLLLPLFDRVLIVVSQEIGSVRAARECFAAAGAEPDSSRFELIVADFDDEIDLSPSLLAKHAGFEVMATLPASHTLLANSHNAGNPLSYSQPRCRYARAITELASRLIGLDTELNAPRSPLAWVLEKMGFVRASASLPTRVAK